MHPYLHFTALPIAVTAAWFAASHWTDSEPGRYRLPSVPKIEDPAAPVQVSTGTSAQPDIRVAAFLPHIPPRPAAPTPTLILHSVMTGTDVHFATINGRVVKEGDSVAGYRVKRIAAEGVELVSGNETRNLPMRPLHELPPPVQPGTDTAQKYAAKRNNERDLTQNFWANFESP